MAQVSTLKQLAGSKLEDNGVNVKDLASKYNLSDDVVPKHPSIVLSFSAWRMKFSQIDIDYIHGDKFKITAHYGDVELPPESEGKEKSILRINSIESVITFLTSCVTKGSGYKIHIFHGDMELYWVHGAGYDDELEDNECDDGIYEMKKRKWVESITPHLQFIKDTIIEY